MDLHARNVLICYRGTLANPDQVRVVFVDVASLKTLEHVSEHDAPGVGIITHIDVRFGSMSETFFEQFKNWLHEAFRGAESSLKFLALLSVAKSSEILNPRKNV